jgi:hypothetical protein
METNIGCCYKAKEILTKKLNRETTVKLKKTDASCCKKVIKGKKTCKTKTKIENVGGEIKKASFYKIINFMIMRKSFKCVHFIYLAGVDVIKQFTIVTFTIVTFTIVTFTVVLCSFVDSITFKKTIL